MTSVYHTLAELQTELSGKGGAYIATLGLFDGVHIGHQYLIEQCISRARAEGKESLVITLDRHPLSVLFPDRPLPHTLASLSQKVKWIEQIGPDHLLVLPFTPELAHLSASAFIAPFIDLGLRGLVLGYDNRFGSCDGRHDSLSDFDQALTHLGLEVHRVTPFLHRGEVVSSSRIRQAIQELHFEVAEELLGRPYTLVGSVQGGRQIGRTIGFPTANVVPYDSQVTLPQVGVYIAEVAHRGQLYPSMAYYGSTPTISDGGQPLYRVEAYLFGFEGELYGEELEVGFRHFLRPDQKFESLQHLHHQLQADADATLHYFQTHSFTLR